MVDTIRLQIDIKYKSYLHLYICKSNGPNPEVTIECLILSCVGIIYLHRREFFEEQEMFLSCCRSQMFSAQNQLMHGGSPEVRATHVDALCFHTSCRSICLILLVLWQLKSNFKSPLYLYCCREKKSLFSHFGSTLRDWSRKTFKHLLNFKQSLALVFSVWFWSRSEWSLDKYRCNYIVQAPVKSSNLTLGKL